MPRGSLSLSRTMATRGSGVRRRAPIESKLFSCLHDRVCGVWGLEVALDEVRLALAAV